MVALVGLSLPFENYHFFRIARLPVDAAHLLGAALLTVTAMTMLRANRRRPDRWLLLTSALLLATPFLAYAAGHLPGFSPLRFWGTWLHLAFLLTIFLVVGTANVTAKEFRAVIAALAVERVGLALYGTWQAIAYPRGWPTGIGFLNQLMATPLRGAVGSAWRATAILQEPKWLAIELNFGLCYAAFLLLFSIDGGRPLTRKAWLVAILGLIAGVLATASLGGYLEMVLLAALAGLLLRRFVYDRRALLGRLLAGLATATVIIGAALLSRSPFAEMVRGRVRNEVTRGEFALGPRSMPSWAYTENLRFGLRAFREAPAFGIGVGQFASVGAALGERWAVPAEMTKSGPWIGYGGILAEFGILGTCVLAALLFAVLRPALVSHHERDAYSALALLLVAAVVLKEASAGFYVHFWTWYPLGIAVLASRVNPTGEETR